MRCSQPNPNVILQDVIDIQRDNIHFGHKKSLIGRHPLEELGHNRISVGLGIVNSTDRSDPQPLPHTALSFIS